MIFGGGIGVKSCFLGGTRFEIEGLFTENSIATITNPLGPFVFLGNTFTNNVAGTDPANGDVKTSAVMVNFLKEFPICNFTAYAGVGIGYANLEFDVRNARTGAGALPTNFSSSDGAFAHQFIVGLDVPLSDCLALFTQYKALGIAETDIPMLNGIHTVDSFYTQSVSAGLRFGF